MSLEPRSLRGVSFDYGHVLGGLDLEELATRLRSLGWEPRIESIRAAMPAAYRAHDEAIAVGKGHQQAWFALMRELLRVADETRGARADAEAELEQAVTTLWDAQPRRNLWRYVPPEARALLETLRRRGVPMVITSNSEGRVAELLEEVGVAHYFASILDSGRLGYGKPEARIFELAAERLGVPLSAMVHVGDSEQADVRGARGAGARAIRFDAFVPTAAAAPTEAEGRAATFGELETLLLGALA